MARLLMPEDFGIVAMGMLVVGLIQTFLDFGATTALLRKDQVSREEIDSAWTLRVIQGLAAGSILFLIPPLAVSFFEEPRLQYILWTFAACVLLASISNIGLTLAQKEFNFMLGFKVETTAKLASVSITLAGGVLFGDYRALVMGIVAGFLAPLATSYLWHPYRPRWNTSKIPEIWAVTKWLLLASIGSFILRKGDELAAARIATTQEYGLYNVGSDLGQLPVQEVGPALLRALLPILSTIQEDVERTNNAIIKTTAAINTIIWPIGLGFAAISEQVTNLLLGDKWVQAVPFVSLFALIAVLQNTTSPVKVLLTLRGHTRTQNKQVWIEFTCFVCAAIVLVPHYSLFGLVAARIFGTLINMLDTLWAAKRYCGLGFLTTLKQILRPMSGAVFMVWLVVYVSAQVSGLASELVISIAVGVACYCTYSLLTWYLLGKPEGLESTVIDRVYRYCNK